MLMYILGMLYSCMMTHNFSLMTLSNAFLKSTKSTQMGACHFIQCSRMFLSVNICSIVPLPCLKPACCWRSLSSTPVLILSIRILQKIVDGTDKRGYTMVVVTYSQIFLLKNFHNEQSSPV